MMSYKDLYSVLNMMLKDQCVSITDLKRHASQYVKELDQGSKYIFVNNKPVAVLVDINQVNVQIDEPFMFDFGAEGVDPQSVLDHFETV